MKIFKDNINREALTNLPFGEQLFLWAIRLWVQEHKTKKAAHHILQHGFKLAGVTNAHRSLDELMTIIAISANRQIQINYPACNEVSIDEHILLDAIAFWMTGEASYKYQLLTINLLPVAAARCAEKTLINIASSFKLAGHIIRRRFLVGTSNSRINAKIKHEPAQPTIH